MTTEPVELPDHEERMTVARARAQWELGDPSWAAVIVRAYPRPDEDRRFLTEEAAQ